MFLLACGGYPLVVAAGFHGLIGMSGKPRTPAEATIHRKEVRVNSVRPICRRRFRVAPLLLLLWGPALAQQPTANHADAGDIQLPRMYRPDFPMQSTRLLGSSYIPMDSWIYPAVWRLYGLGYVDTAFLGLRPWTRLSVLHMLEQTGNIIATTQGVPSDEAEDIFLALVKELAPDAAGDGAAHAELDTVYSRFLGITNTPLRDSYHLGQTIINDYGRPYQAGIVNSSGASGRAEFGRFSLSLRGEYQRSPSAVGYSAALGDYLSKTVDNIPIATNPVQDTDPIGPIASVSNIRLLEATASMHLAGHEFSFGKTDRWWGPGQGGAFAWSNNAENIYAFEVNRVDPVRVPLLSRITGPFRYDFTVGSLQGHTAPNHPWIHSEKLSFKPTRDLEFGFERSVIWGGRGHEPITIGTFLRSFFSTVNVTAAIKGSNKDPGARFGSFDFTWRLPYLRNWLTLYTDSVAHDDVNPISAPRRASVHPGIYLSHTPFVQQLDLRVEAASTDPPTSRSHLGQFVDYEAIQRQGTTNKGQLIGDAIGREDKGGQAWVTYHLSPNEYFQGSFRSVKAAKDFIAGGTTQLEYTGEVVKRLSDDVELKGWVQYEQWKAPIYRPGSNTDVGVAGQITWYPHETKVLGR